MARVSSRRVTSFWPGVVLDAPALVERFLILICLPSRSSPSFLPTTDVSSTTRDPHQKERSDSMARASTSSSRAAASSSKKRSNPGSTSNSKIGSKSRSKSSSKPYLEVRQDDDCALQIGEFIAQVLDENKKPMRIYAPQRDGEHVAECFIEAESGKRFMVRAARITATEDQLYRTRILLGGKQADGGAMVHSPRTWNAMHRGTRISKDARQPWTFASPALTDDDENSLRDLSEIAGLAEIKAQVVRIREYEQVEPRYKFDALGSDRPVYERSKKIGSMSFLHGAAEHRPTHSKRYSTKSDPKAPVLEFRFRCTTRFGLELLKLVPSSQDNPQQASGSASQPSAAESAAGPSRKRPRDDEVLELDAEAARLRQELHRLEQRRAALAEWPNGRGEGSSSGAQGDASTGQISFTVKTEKKLWNYSGGGSAANPVEILDDDDDE
ncbi:hypothetical protein V8E36_009898 [Tilletia maclaganii]